ncbi:MAG: NYN domain-containing protein [Thermoplasmata archaeon]|nr:MAG: NYN domain-containing protein [Thermoplasmata archaeon]
MPRSKKRDTREVMVVPIKEETFAAAKKIHVYAVPIVRSTSDVHHIAFYRGAPTSAITHYAKVTKIEKNLTFPEVFPGGSSVVTRKDQALKVYRLDDLKELKRRVKKGRNPPVSGPRYTDLATLRKARYLDEVWPPDGAKAKSAKKEKVEPEPKRAKRKGKKKTEEKPKPEPKPAKKEEEGKKKRRKRGSKMKKAAKEGESVPIQPSVHYIVDGSNVAMEARSFKEGGRLDQLELVMEKLAQTKGAAITVLVDANLRHHIDRKDDLEELIKDRRVLQTPAQTDADEFILQTAEAHRSRGEEVVIITNDRYLDYIKKYKPRFDWVRDASKRFMFVFSSDGSEALEAIISLN